MPAAGVEPDVGRRARRGRGRGGAGRRSRAGPCSCRRPRARPAPGSCRARDLELELELELAQRGGELHPEHGRPVRQRTTPHAAEQRRAAEQLHRQQQRRRDRDQHRRERQRRGEVASLKLGEDRQRRRLRDPLERAGEHQRRAELAQRPPPGERHPGADPGSRARDRDAGEGARLAGPERARGVEQVRVDGGEGGLRLAQVERRGDEGERDDHPGRLQHELDPGVVEPAQPKIPSGPKAASRPIPATAGGSTSGSSIAVVTSDLARGTRASPAGRRPGCRRRR